MIGVEIKSLLRRLNRFCTRTLEGAPPLPTPNLPEGPRWRLEVSFLVPALADLPKVPWWRRFIPDGWRSGPSSGSHIG